MIRWYDILAGISVAQLMMVAFFNLPIIGAVVAYGLWVAWRDYYCIWRKEQEDFHR